eukprot:TRINITY_DN13002_c0_g1_i1.p1 TRINITY_DN13002_c0_g1~~TRINITY_DN13002_c0_g1_i1.p1  ORF type:complete len:791 (+),score=144.45 TRINITY_DN13002_c0_g1_i1:59-2374(+)
MGRKRPRKTQKETKQENEELTTALETLRSLVNIEDFVTELTKLAEDDRQVGRDVVTNAVKASLKTGIDVAEIKESHIDQVMIRSARGKRVPKQKETDQPTAITIPGSAFVSEVIWVMKHHGIMQSAEERQKARGCQDERPTNTFGAKQFFSYYKAQKIMPDDQLEQFSKSISTPLPMVLRLTGTRTYTPEINKQLTTRVELSKNLSPVTWISGSTRAVKMPHSLYHSKEEELKSVNQWCKDQHSLGTAAFQEEVSLLPVHLLCPEPSDLVLDMCSAPGSKLMHCADIMTEKSLARGTPITGGIVSNEIEKKKARQILPGRLKRGHASHIIVLQSDARLLPRFIDKTMNRILFDKIICDVPCTGDGTARKAESLETWSTHYGLGLHHKQLQILLKGIDSLAVGGRLVYSTCSLNPIENESVVAGALSAKFGEVQIESISPSSIPGLTTQPGLSSWMVPDEDGVLYSDCPSEKEVLQQKNWRSTMFPPTDANVSSQLCRCIRMLPHHNDTGGFFVTVFTRTAEAVPDEDEPVPILPRKAQQDDNSAMVVEEAPPKNSYKLGGMRNAKLYYELGSGVDEIWKQVRTYYDFSATEPNDLKHLTLLVQMDDHDRSKKKNMFTCSPGVLRILRSYIPNTQSNFVVVSAVGCRLLSLIKGNYLKGQTDCQYRPAFEGCRTLASISSPLRRVFLSVDEIITLLDQKSIPLTQLSVQPSPLFVGPCMVGLSHQQLDGDNSIWSDLWLSCILLSHKVELNVEDHERLGLLKLLTTVFKSGA